MACTSAPAERMPWGRFARIYIIAVELAAAASLPLLSDDSDDGAFVPPKFAARVAPPVWELQLTSIIEEIRVFPAIHFCPKDEVGCK